jgi:putative methionine-R-sulfoxide reductase with GAF domain/HAMP domain-containing protein
MGKTGETLIVNQDVFALNDLRWQEDAILNLKISAAPAVKAAQGETGIIEVGDYRGEEVLAAYTHIPQTGWGFVAKRDLDEIYAPIHSMLVSMVFVVVVVILFVVAISLFIARSISYPIRDLTRATTRMASGEEGVRVDVRTGDELEVMATAFNQMASKLDTAREEVMARDWLNAGITGLDDVIRGEKELSQLCTDSITMLARYLDVQVGTLSLADHGNAQLTLTAHYAYQEKPGATTTFGFGEGLVGQAALEKKQILINEVSDAPITITSALGAMAPRSILCLPLLYEGEVAGVIELGSLHPFTELQQKFLQQIEERLAIAIRVAQSRETQKALLEETQAQSEELQTQQEELRDSNEELEEKSQALTAERAQSKEERRKS